MDEQEHELENQILELRAERLRHAPRGVDEETVVWIAEFPLADERYALPLDRLRAAVPLKLVRPVPLSPPHVIGILRFQGTLISAVSLASLVGVRGWRRDPTVLIILSLDGSPVDGRSPAPGENPPTRAGSLVAFDCETIPKPVALRATLVEEARARAGDAGVLEVTTPELETIHLIDLDRLWKKTGHGH